MSKFIVYHVDPFGVSVTKSNESTLPRALMQGVVELGLIPPTGTIEEIIPGGISLKNLASMEKALFELNPKKEFIGAHMSGDSEGKDIMKAAIFITKNKDYTNIYFKQSLDLIDKSKNLTGQSMQHPAGVIIGKDLSEKNDEKMSKIGSTKISNDNFEDFLKGFKKDYPRVAVRVIDHEKVGTEYRGSISKDENMFSYFPTIETFFYSPKHLSEKDVSAYVAKGKINGE